MVDAAAAKKKDVKIRKFDKNELKQNTLQGYITQHIGRASIEQLNKLVDGAVSPARLNVRSNSKKLLSSGHVTTASQMMMEAIGDATADPSRTVGEDISQKSAMTHSQKPTPGGRGGKMSNYGAALNVFDPA